MKPFYRLWKIIAVVIKYRLSDLLLDLLKLPTLKPLVYLTPWQYFPNKEQSEAVRIRLALEELGPIFIKFGQTLSTRRDLLPEQIGLELSKLQDTCPAFDSKQAVQMISQSLGGDLTEFFTRFDEKPLAAASIAQVHTAQTLSGDEVVVKVLRPNIKAIIDKDLALLAKLAQLIDTKKPLLRAPEAVLELRRILHNELDMVNEAANTDRLAKNFKNSDLLYVPKVYWALSTKQILVSERIYGTPVNDIATLRAKNIDLQTLARQGVIIFFTQVFEHNFFHADMHPGNIFVGDNGQYHGVDFGIMGTLSKTDLWYLSESFLGFFNEDYHRIAMAHLKAGHIKDTIDIDAFENSLAGVCIPLLKKPLSEISFGQVLMKLLGEAKRFDIEVQPQLLLLDKTLLNVEGLGRQLYPELDLWATAKPFLERLSKQKYQPEFIFKQCKQHLPEWINTLPSLPQLSHDVLSQLATASKNNTQQQTQLNALEVALKRQVKQNNLLLALLCAIAALGFWELIAQPIYTGGFGALALIFALRGAN